MMRVKGHREPLIAAWLTLPLILSVASAGLADEPPSPGVPLPGLESDPPGSVTPRSAAVMLRDGRVTLDLAVNTTADAAGLVLNGPWFGWSGAMERYPDRQFPELKIRLNGADITPQDRFEAMVGRTNITSWLRAADMDPWAITRNPPVTTAHPSNPQILNALRNAGAIAGANPATDAAATAEAAGLYTAKWVARRIVVIPLTPGADTTLQLEYTARPGLAMLTADGPALSALERRYCLSGKELQRLRSALGNGPVWISEYVVPSGVDGKSSPSVTFSWTAPDTAPKTSPNRAYWCGAGGKSMIKRGMAVRERASTDESGVLHVLMIPR
jgi:hypothetical protein